MPPHRRRCSVWQLAAICFCASTIWLSIELQVFSSSSPSRFESSRVSSNTRGLRESADKADKVTLALFTQFSDLARALACIASLRLHMPEWAVHELLVVAPYAESLVLSSLLEPQSAYTLTWPMRVVPDNVVLGVPNNAITSHPDAEEFFYKFKLQMALKLFVYKQVATDFYVVLDSDVVQLQPLQTIRWLIPEPGRAVYKQEPRSVHSDYWSTTESYFKLGGCLPTDPNTPASGVTPAVFSTAIAEKTVSHILEFFGEDPKSWMPALLSVKNPLWTEHTAYRLVACKYQLFDMYHKEQLPGAPNLYGGCWTPESTLNNTIKAPDNSIFLVVQSNTNVPVKKVVEDLDKSDVFSW